MSEYINELVEEYIKKSGNANHITSNAQRIRDIVKGQSFSEAKDMDLEAKDDKEKETARMQKNAEIVALLYENIKRINSIENDMRTNNGLEDYELSEKDKKLIDAPRGFQMNFGGFCAEKTYLSTCKKITNIFVKNDKNVNALHFYLVRTCKYL